MRVASILFAVLALCFFPSLAAESMAPAGVSTVKLSWETLVTIYGPMAGVILWFMWLERARMAQARERDGKLLSVIEASTAAIVSVNATLVQVRAEGAATSECSRAENEKNRTAIYRLTEEVHDLRPTAGGNTRAMRHEE